MSLPAEVRLPRDARPQFPARCVVCDRVQPDHQLRLSGRELGWLTLLSVPGAKYQVKVPACKACSKSQRTRNTFFEILAFVVVIVIAFFIQKNFPAIRDLPGGSILRHLIALLIAIILLSPMVWWWITRSIAIDITVLRKHVDFSFRCRKYAEDFAHANGTTVRESCAGVPDDRSLISEGQQDYD